VDTTGAGDACVGALAAAMALGKPFTEAVADGIRAGSTAGLAPGVEGAREKWQMGQLSSPQADCDCPASAV